ncbi:MAG: glycerophosphodiester phosphodiesterase family protein, partial [Chitinophagaceae bacterium]
MKGRIFRFKHIFLVYILFISCSVSKNSFQKEIADGQNIVIAHRGAWKKDKLPENSIASLKQSIVAEYSGSEFDVRMTADDSLVINHDPEYNKLSIEKTKYADLITFRLSNGETLPTLREYILAGKENNTSTSLICEIKPSEIST